MHCNAYLDTILMFDLTRNQGTEPQLGGEVHCTLIFSSYVGSGPASTFHPQKYQEFQAPKKKIIKF